MTDPGKGRRVTRVRQLAEDVIANISDLLRVRSVRKESARMFRDFRLMRWIAAEARAVVSEGVEPDPWSVEEVSALAERIRMSAVAERSGVRRLSGRPPCVPRPQVEPGSSYSPATRGGEAIPWVQLATAAGIGRELWDEECDTWVSLPGDLPRGNYVALNVSGESMVPLLHDADVVLVNMAAVPRPGDIVLARTAEGYVVKRLARMSVTGIVLESLNPEFRPISIGDQSRPIVGVVVLSWCEHEAHSSTARIR